MIRKQTQVSGYLWDITEGVKRYIAALIVVQILIGENGVLYAFCLRNIINASARGNESFFYKSVFEFMFLAGVQVLLRGMNRYLDEYTRSLVENRSKERLMNQLLCREYAAVSMVHSGEWMNRLTNDTVVVADGIVQILPGLAGMGVKLLAAMTALIVLEPKFAGLILPAGILFLLMTLLFRKKMKSLHKRVQEADGTLRSFLQEVLNSILTVHAYAVEDTMSGAACEKMSKHRKERLHRNYFSNFSNIGFGFLMNGAYVLGAAFCGYEILHGSIDYGTFLAVIQLVGQIQTPFANITGFIPRYYSMTASAERLIEVESYEDKISEKHLDEVETEKYYQEKLDGIGVRNLDFSYVSSDGEDKSKVLQNISLYIKKGDSIAFTGVSGCGKSTLLKLLLCLYRQDTGERYLKSKDGREEELTSHWQHLFAYVPQGNELLSGSIRQILSFYDEKKEKEDSAMWNALTIACADGFVREWENGLDTVLGEHGSGVSEGQSQRLAIARAIFCGGPILMLDEATSALDMETEARVLENIKQMTDKTVVIVTHRPAALKICNRRIEFTEDGCEERQTTDR